MVDDSVPYVSSKQVSNKFSKRNANVLGAVAEPKCQQYFIERNLDIYTCSVKRSKQPYPYIKLTVIINDSPDQAYFLV